MKNYIAPEMKVLQFDACDIIQTSAETTTVSVPKTVVKGSGTAQEAAAVGTTNYSNVSSILE